MPNLIAAAPRELRKVRVTFDGALADLTAGANGALNPSNWTFAGQPIGYQAVAPVTCSLVEQVSTSEFDITVNDDFSPGLVYLVSAKAAADGGITGVPASPNNQATFAGLVPSAPEGRDFDLWPMLPQLNRGEDDSGDLARFINCLQDLHTLQLYRIDTWTNILDFDLAPENFLDLMLQDLGFPFQIALSVLDKRRLLSILVRMYKQKGTAAGIKNAIRFFVGYEADVVVRPRPGLGGWVLDYSILDVDTVLGGGTYYDPVLHGPDLAAFSTNFDFIVKVGKPLAAALTADEDQKVRAVVDHMKAAHEHLIAVESVLPPPAAVSAVGGSGQVTVNWSAVAGAVGYAVFWDTGPGASASSATGAVDPDNASPYVNTPVVAGQRRYYVVCARDGGGINGVASAMVNAAAT